MIVKDALEEAAERVAGREGSNSRRTARLLLADALGVGQEWVLAHGNDSVPAAAQAAYQGLIERRAAGEPLQYIRGRQEFYGLDFAVTPDVLIPRPETELLVTTVLSLAQTGMAARYEAATPPCSPLIVDLGTGSGCIAVALAVYLPAAPIIAIDISEAALLIARSNAERHGVASRIRFLAGDMLEPLSAAGVQEGAVDFIACNPPYVPLSAPELLQEEVRKHEPAVALYGGRDGLAFYRRLFAAAKPVLKHGGRLIFEMGYKQMAEIESAVDRRFWRVESVGSDLQGVPRTMTLSRL